MKTNAKKCGLLREGFRQCQMIGICALVLILLLVILQAISGYIDYSNENSLYTAQAYQMNLGALLAIPMTFFMTLRLFRFLNDRAASDFYHALPHKRLFLYGSFIGAIILWILIWVVGSMLVTTLLCCMQPNLQLLYNTILPYTLSVIFMCLLTASGTLLVMGITGTGFTNVVLSLVLLFIPRFCVAYFQMLLQNYLPFFLNRSNTGFFSNSSNLLFSLLASIFDFSDIFTLSSVLTPTWKPLVYTLLLSLCYFAIGGFFFQRRRSEAAGQSAPSKYLQHCYRILITMIPCLFFTSVLTLEIKLGNAVDDAFLYVIIYVPIVLLYFAYELITTRKWKNLLTAVPGLGVVVLLNVGILFGVNLVYNQILSNRPDADEIESISIYQGNDYDSDFYFTFSAYAGMQSHNVKITDETAITLVSEYLNENLTTWESNHEKYYNQYYNYDFDESGSKSSYTAYCVDICTGSSTISRIIFFPTDAVEQLSDALQTNEAYRAIWYQLPDYVENTLYLDGDYNLSQADLTEILESYQAERLSCDFDTLFTQSDDTSDEYQTLTYTFQNGGSSALLECVLSEKLTPNTLQLVYDKISTSQVENVENLVENIACKNPNIYYTFSANAYDYSVRMDSEQYRLNMDGDLDGAIADDQDLLQLFWSYVDLDASLTVGEPKVVIYAYDAENGIDTSMLLPIDTAVFADDTITESNAFSLYYYNESAGYIFIK